MSSMGPPVSAHPVLRLQVQATEHRHSVWVLKIQIQVLMPALQQFCQLSHLPWPNGNKFWNYKVGPLLQSTNTLVLLFHFFNLGVKFLNVFCISKGTYGYSSFPTPIKCSASLSTYVNQQETNQVLPKEKLSYHNLDLKSLFTDSKPENVSLGQRTFWEKISNEFWEVMKTVKGFELPVSVHRMTSHYTEPVFHNYFPKSINSPFPAMKK